MKEYDRSDLGYKVERVNSKEVVRWVCYDCASCVICKAKGGKGIYRRRLGIRYSGALLFDLYFCKEHKDRAVEVIGLNFRQVPMPTLQAMHDYAMGLRAKLALIDSLESRHRIGQLNRMTSGWKEILQGKENVRAGERETQVVIKEVVKIPCRHCGTFSPVTEAKCPSCGAPLLRQ
jgi:hypothetical protein